MTIRIPLAAAAIAAAALAFAAPSAAAPCDVGRGMDNVEYALEIAGTPPKTYPPCEDYDGDGFCDNFCPDYDGDGYCDVPYTEGPNPPEPPSPTPYEPDCDIMQSECDSGCDSASTQDEYDDCVDSCMSNAGC